MWGRPRENGQKTSKANYILWIGNIASSNDRRKRAVLFTYPYFMAVIHDYFTDAYPEYILKPPSDSEVDFLFGPDLDHGGILTNSLSSTIWILQDWFFLWKSTKSCLIILEKTAVIPFGVYQFLHSHPNILQAYRLKKYFLKIFVSFSSKFLFCLPLHGQKHICYNL
jgi:hypothetical protein